MTQPNTQSFSTSETPHKCVFCGKPTEYYKPGIGYICAKCLGEYEGSYWREMWKKEKKVEPEPTFWYPSLEPPSTTWPVARIPVKLGKLTQPQVVRGILIDILDL